jgi:hypothetical protein
MGERNENWQQFKDAMPQNTARWAIYDLEFEEEDGR